MGVDRNALTEVPALVRVAIGAVVGAVAGTLDAIFVSTGAAPLVGWDALVLTYVILTWSRLWPLDAKQTAHRAIRHDPTRVVAYTLLLTAALVSLVAVVVVLFGATRAKGTAEVLRVALGVGSVALSWALVHTTFALRYARLYYREAAGGIDFNQPDAPRYTDFAYLAFTIGMTFQVSDTSLTNPLVRRTALIHAMMSYLLGTVILASTVNLIAGLSR
jgi:uncharacterized membrane protein